MVLVNFQHLLRPSGRFFYRPLTLFRVMTNDFTVGEPFPVLIPFSRKGIEVCQAHTNQSFFDVLYYTNSRDREEITTWEKGCLRYGLYIEEALPFFASEFLASPINFVVSLNIFKMGNEEQVLKWFNDKSTDITLYLIDASTNMLLAKRLIVVAGELAHRIKECLVEQIEVYLDSNAVTRSILEIMHLRTAQDILNSAESTAFIK